MRSGALAVEVATRVFEARREAASAETLAMAFAEAGRFDRALELQRQLVAAAEQAGAKDESAGLRNTNYRVISALSRGETPGPENSITKVVSANKAQELSS